MTDILIIGGGTAGLTAAVYARRAGKSVIIFEKENVGGQIVYAPRVDNYPGLPGVSGADFAASTAAQAESAGADLRYEEVLQVSWQGNHYVVHTDCSVYEGKAVIAACGTQHRRLGLKGEDDLLGAGVSYCAVCDGAFCSGKDVAVVGGGSTALTDALFLSGICRSVTIIHRRDTFRGEDSLLKELQSRSSVRFLLDSAVESLEESQGMLTGIRVKQLKTGESSNLSIQGLFIAVGRIPQTSVFQEMVKTDESGYLAAGEDCITSQKGFFAAGDCRTKQVRQLTTAAGDGAASALAACRYVDSCR